MSDIHPCSGKAVLAGESRENKKVRALLLSRANNHFNGPVVNHPHSDDCALFVLR